MLPKIIYKETETIEATGPVEKITSWIEEQLYIFYELTPTETDWYIDLLHGEPVLFDYHCMGLYIVWYDFTSCCFRVKEVHLPWII